MKIETILVNHMIEPLGFDLSQLRIEFKLSGAFNENIQKQLTINNADKVVFQSEWSSFPNNYFDVDLQLAPRTQYVAKVAVKTDTDILEKTTPFETGKMNEDITAKWIGGSKAFANTVFRREFKVDHELKRGRLYLTGLGLYEVAIDGQKIGDEYLTPGVTAYDQWVQIQTYDVTSALTKGDHELTVSVADGWYKGNYGFDGGKDKIYGDRHMIIGELHEIAADGTDTQIVTDDSWETAAGKVTASAIYYGEDFDDTHEIKDWQSAVDLDHDKSILSDRLSLPLKVQEELPVASVIKTPAGETVLDFGQNHAGWLKFLNTEPKGTTLKFEMGEILQEGNFYRGNLREARAAFTYVSDGQEKWVRPHFTYFGYRYVKVTGNTQPINAKNFKSQVIYSDMAETGQIETDNKKVNRLFANVQWGQKSNFFDVPTDCPQRDERLGWTGDADIFSNTAALNMNVYAFFKKYARDMALEQANHDGKLTMYAPAMGEDDGGAAVWGDAATVIPWHMYEMYGDPAILQQNFQSMQDWVDWVSRSTKTEDLWTGCFQFGDWLALDGENPALPIGKTEEDFIASVYYYYSSSIVSKAARVLNQPQVASKYGQLASRIKAAIQREYITANGRVAMDTQTAYALVLYFHLVPDNQLQRVVNDLVKRLDKDDNHLKTGFVGTPFICRVLSENGQHKLAVKLFLNEDYPSWLYAVNLGATTVWERWNSVMPNGSMNPEGMNSLNHYSIGAVMEWAYKDMLGISSHDAGYETVTISPHFDYRLKQVKGHFDSPYGVINVAYQIEADDAHHVVLHVDIPVGQTAKVVLPRSTDVDILVNNTHRKGILTLGAGHYDISYLPTHDYIERYSLTTPLGTIMADTELVPQLKAISGQMNFFASPDIIKNMGKMTIPKINEVIPAVDLSHQELSELNDLLSKTPLLSERL